MSDDPGTTEPDVGDDEDVEPDTEEEEQPGGPPPETTGIDGI